MSSNSSSHNYSNYITPIKPSFNVLLGRYIDKKFSTPYQVARDSGLSENIVNDWLNGADMHPTQDDINKIARVLELKDEERDCLLQASVRTKVYQD